MKRKILSIVFAIAMLFCCTSSFTASAAEEKTGLCGADITWVLDESGKLTLTGHGDMIDYTYSGNGAAPWVSFRNQINNVVMSDGITSIGMFAFSSCTNIERFVVSKDLKKIGASAFYDCQKLTKFDIPSGVNFIGDYAFHRCYNIRSIDIPDGVKRIGAYTFHGCGAISELTIGSGVESIGEQAFVNCQSITSIDIPYNTYSIAQNAFSGCNHLSKVTLQKNVELIGANAFYGCPITAVYYGGTEADWKKMTIGLGNDPILNAAKHFSYSIPSPSSRCTLYYDANGGNEPPSPVTVNSGESVKVSTEKLSRTGYEFLGWSKTPSSKSPEYRGGEKITLKQNTTLYAVWNDPNAKYDTVIVLTIDKTEATVNGETVYNDVAPIIENSRTMLPARFVAEKLGATVAWNDAERKVTITGADGTKIEIIVDSTTAYVNGTAHTLDSPAFIRNSRTYTPVRFICDNLGANILWDNDTRTVTITK